MKMIKVEEDEELYSPPEILEEKPKPQLQPATSPGRVKSVSLWSTASKLKQPSDNQVKEKPKQKQQPQSSPSRVRSLSFMSSSSKRQQPSESQGKAKDGFFQSLSSWSRGKMTDTTNQSKSGDTFKSGASNQVEGPSDRKEATTNRSQSKETRNTCNPCIWIDQALAFLLCCRTKIDAHDKDVKQKSPQQRTRKSIHKTKKMMAKKKKALCTSSCRKTRLSHLFIVNRGFDWAKLLKEEPKLSKKNRKAAKTIFRVLERMNCTRELAGRTFSALFRMYPRTVAYMVSTVRESCAPANGFKPDDVVASQSSVTGYLEDFGSTFDYAFKSNMFNQREIAYFTPMTLRHSFLSDSELAQFSPLITHLGAVTASLVYVTNVMHDVPEVFMFLDELARIHADIPGMDAIYFRHVMESLDEGLLNLIGADIYKDQWRRSMVHMLEWIYYYSTRDIPDAFKEKL